MTRWAVITIALYVLLLVALAGPLTVAALMPPPEGHYLLRGWDFWYLYGEWAYWIVIVVLAFSQALMLIVPVKITGRRPIKKRHVMAPVIAAGLLTAALVVSGLASLDAGIFGDDAPDPVDIPGGESWAWINLFGAPLFFWALWALLFWSFSYTTPEPRQWMRRLVRWLLAGSILELLVAVSCHIVVRKRGDCSAPIGTSLGIAAGVAVMLFSFGPGVFYLFAERKKRITGLLKKP